MFGGGADKKIAGNVEKKTKVKVEFEAAVASAKAAMEGLKPAVMPDGAEGGGPGEGKEGGKTEEAMRLLRCQTLEEQLADHERLTKSFVATLYGVFQVRRRESRVRERWAE